MFACTTVHDSIAVIARYDVLTSLVIVEVYQDSAYSLGYCRNNFYVTRRCLVTWVRDRDKSSVVRVLIEAEQRCPGWKYRTYGRPVSIYYGAVITLS